MSRLKRLLQLKKIETPTQVEELKFFIDCLTKSNNAKKRKITRLSDQNFEMRKILMTDSHFYSNLLVKGRNKKIHSIEKEFYVAVSQLKILKELETKQLLTT